MFCNLCIKSDISEVNLAIFSCAAELKKQRDFYQKLGMEVPGDIKGELCNMKVHLETQRNGMLHTHLVCFLFLYYSGLS